MTDDEALAIMMALADTGRFEIFRKVLERPALAAAELSAGKAASTTSHHLKKLEQASILRSTRVAKTKQYAVDKRTLLAFAGWVNGCVGAATFNEEVYQLLDSD